MDEEPRATSACARANTPALNGEQSQKSVAQPPFSLLKFSVPIAAMPQALILAPTDDTSLRAGAYQKDSLTGAEETLTVSTSTTTDQVLVILMQVAA